MRRDVPRRLFRGRDMAVIAEQARRALGDDAVMLATRTTRQGAAVGIECVAASAAEVERFQRMLAGTLPEPVAGEGTTVVAVVGPTGAGKTTTLAKLAVHPEAFGTRRVALATLDTYRAGAVAQLETYAHVAKLPLEVVYDVADAEQALARQRRADVLLVDTPGRGPRGVAGEPADAWRAALDALAPDEVHLVLPATIRPDVAEAMRERFDAQAVAAGGRPISHLVLTKLDECPGEEGVTELAARLALPVRWVADGQEIPSDLAPGAPRLVRALGAFGGMPAEDAAFPLGGLPA
jgi:flagellar biosynthesis protein FlhF